MHLTLTLNLFPSNSTPSLIALFKSLMESSKKCRLSGLFPPTEIESGNTFAGLIFTTEHKTGHTEVLLLLKRESHLHFVMFMFLCEKFFMMLYICFNKTIVQQCFSKMAHFDISIFKNIIMTFEEKISDVFKTLLCLLGMF